MLIYLDNWCFNRPFDDQNQMIIHLEARAVLGIQEKIITGEYSLIWSYMISFENSNNPREITRKEIAKWLEFEEKAYCPGITCSASGSKIFDAARS